jgi:hypothetical protein
MLHPSSGKSGKPNRIKNSTGFISISGSKCGGDMEKLENVAFNDR